MQKISPCLWFDNQAEEAVNVYVKIFKDAKIGRTTYYDEVSAIPSGQKPGTVLTIEFELEGQNFTALNGGPLFKFTEAMSLVIDCKDQAEIDHYWNELTKDGGQEQPCGWLKDKFGVSWQVVPTALNDMLTDPNSEKAQKASRAMFSMKKIDIAAIEAAYNG